MNPLESTGQGSQQQQQAQQASTGNRQPSSSGTFFRGAASPSNRNSLTVSIPVSQNNTNNNSAAAVSSSTTAAFGGNIVGVETTPRHSPASSSSLQFFSGGTTAATTAAQSPRSGRPPALSSSSDGILTTPRYSYFGSTPSPSSPPPFSSFDITPRQGNRALAIANSTDPIDDDDDNNNNNSFEQQQTPQQLNAPQPPATQSFASFLSSSSSSVPSRALLMPPQQQQQQQRRQQGPQTPPQQQQQQQVNNSTTGVAPPLSTGPLVVTNIPPLTLSYDGSETYTSRITQRQASFSSSSLHLSVHQPQSATPSNTIRFSQQPQQQHRSVTPGSSHGTSSFKGANAATSNSSHHHSHHNHNNPPNTKSRTAPAANTASSSTSTTSAPRMIQTPLPAPRSPSKCPLFCCFYAEFDIKVGPKVCYQSPPGFMECDIAMSLDQVHDMLQQTFRPYAKTTPVVGSKTADNEKHSENNNNDNNIIQVHGTETVEQAPPLPKRPLHQHETQAAMGSRRVPNRTSSSSSTLSSSSSRGRGGMTSVTTTTTPPPTTAPAPAAVSKGDDSSSTVGPAMDYNAPGSTSSSTTNVATSTGQQSSTNKVTNASAADETIRKESLPNRDETISLTTPLPTPPPSSPACSIFDSCSEYIITGQELTGNIINLSTHLIHVITRPTIISNERYERNSLLFCVGFVLRRTEDPRPFRPVLSKWALTLRDLEIETQFLSNPATRPRLQILLEQILVSLNSPSWECNLLLSPANVLNLKLFHPPRLPACPVADYAVPVFLRRDWQVQAYDWDLSINWVSLHIDGVTNARQLSKKAEVDMEMVRACLRVLKHHGVIALVDMFFYSNRYECTDRAAALLAGKEPRLLHEAADFVMRRNIPGDTSTITMHPPSSPGGADHSSRGGYGTDGEQQPMLSRQQYLNNVTSSSPIECRDYSMAGSLRFGASVTSQASLEYFHGGHGSVSQRREEVHEVKQAIAEFLMFCNRNVSIGDLWINLMIQQGHDAARSSYVDWRKMFEIMDNRRLTSFGLVHGLLRRVHNFPFLVDAADFIDEATRGSPACDSPQLESASSGERVIPAERATMVRAHSGGLRNYNDQQPTKDELRQMAVEVAGMMDGRHCDDDLVCYFERSLEDLLDLFEGRQIISVLAAS